MMLAATPFAPIANASMNGKIDLDDFAEGGHANDEKYWLQIRKKYFSITDDFINLENGFFGVQSNPVLKAFHKNIDLVNSQLSKFARTDYPKLFSSIKKEVAQFLNVSDEEIIFTRNATEALNIVIQGYPFKEGDEVLLSQLDYSSMIETFQMLEKRGRISIKTIDLPLWPKSEDELVEFYMKSITSKTKLVLLTQVSNVNGLIIPIKKIADKLKPKGIDIICDSAHALGHIPFNLKEMNADFVGLNLHKWIGNPIGAGVLYIKKERIKEMQLFWGDAILDETDIMKLAHYGTTQFAVMMTIPDSIAFHQLIGVEKISKRVQFLKSIWVDALKDHPNVEVLIPGDETLSCAIASFRLKNKPVPETAAALMDQYKIFTMQRDIGNGKCIRVTPSFYNTEKEIQEFVKAVKMLAV